MNILLVFTILTIVNVVFSTIKSIATVKASPAVASLVNGLYYGYYNVVLLFTVAEFPLWQKVVVTALCNFVGVYIVKWIENKMRKDRLWLVQCTIPENYTEPLHFDLKNASIPHNYVENVGSNTLFYIYSYTQKESEKLKPLIRQYQGKYFVSESRGEL